MGANSAMLRLARQWKGFHQTDAAKRLGIDQSLLSRIENGLVEPRDDILLGAQNAYGLPRSFFELTDTVYGAPVSVHPMWRRKQDVSARELDAIVAELNVRVMHLRRFLEAMEFAHTSNIPRLDIEDYDDAEKIAGLVRAHWQVPRGPIRDLTLLVERAGALVTHSRMGGTSISGVTFSVPGLPPLIVLNAEQPADRMRYTLAHELAHLVMHRFPTPTMEQEANKFAGALLMPADDIAPYFVGRRIDLALLAAFKPEWKVAMQALLMRASSLGYLTPNQQRYLWKQINARRLRLREPPELDFPHEQPTVISRMVQLHMDSLGYSGADLAKLLHVHESHLRDLYSMDNRSSPQNPRLTVIN